jgi:hypothetical protein
MYLFYIRREESCSPLQDPCYQQEALSKSPYLTRPQEHPADSTGRGAIKPEMSAGSEAPGKGSEFAILASASKLHVFALKDPDTNGVIDQREQG